ncbi:MAG: rod shape-determining protein MreB [Verrucomicrobiales bacterium]|jgi:rod shape-determining protein MreB
MCVRRFATLLQKCVESMLEYGPELPEPSSIWSVMADGILSSFANFGSFSGRDMAVDLGTANTLVYVRGEGIVLNEPSVVAVNVHTGEPLAVGAEAKRMIGRTPSHIQAVRPLKDGVIADFDICEKMLRYFIERVHPRKWSRPRMVICVPSGITGVEQRAVQEAAEFAGARKPAFIIEEPMAAAIGSGLPIQEPTGSMIVDIGGGTTEVAVISLGGVVASQSVRVGGDELDEAIVQYVKKEFSVAVGDRTAEEIKKALGSAWPLDRELQADIRGRDLVTGLPKTIGITSVHMREAMAEPISAICDAVKMTLDQTPPELAADIMQRGVCLAGGGALLQGLEARIGDETGMPVFVADRPLEAVALGSGQSLEEFESLRGVLFSSGSI